MCHTMEENIRQFARLSILGVFVFLIIFLSCRIDRSDEETILVFAAASLVDVLNETSEKFYEDTGIKVFFNYGGSQKLAIDIISGAPADMFISAGYEPMNTVSKLPDIEPSEIINIASNRLVIAAKENIVKSVVLDDLLNMSRVSIADPELAPAGYYAKESLHNLGLWKNLFPIILYGSDVRMAMAYVQVGNADAAIVYKTDVSAASGLVGYDVIPQNSYPLVVYPVVYIDRNNKRENSSKYLNFLKSEYVLEVFSRHGFGAPND